MKILITGANGFVGRALVTRLGANSEWQVRAVVRRKVDDLPSDLQIPMAAGLSPDAQWSEALHGIDVVVHTAARVHVMRDTSLNPLEEFRRVNVDGTMRLARQAAQAGVQRFVFMSSIKVNGECTAPGKSFQAGDRPYPADPYAISKHETEEQLRGLGAESGMQLVIIRPPLIYGPGVKANFLSMMQWIYRGMPLPLGSIDNKRSLVALDNLTDLISVCVHHANAANRTFLVADGEDLSTTDLLRRIGSAMGRSARLFAFPQSILRCIASMTGNRGVARRLCDSLQVDIAETRGLLGWYPLVSVDEALNKTASHFLAALQR